MSHNVTKPVVLLLPEFKRSGTGRKFQAGTNVIIRVGPNLVASAKLGGKYSEEQALKEFKKYNSKFKVPDNMLPVAELIRKS